MANRIFLNNDEIIEVVIEGDQTYMTFENLKYDAMDMLSKLQKEGKQRRGIINIAKIGKFNADSNRAAMEILESLNYDKAALYGANTILTEVTKAIILAMGKGNNTKLFPDRDSAMRWLNEASQVSETSPQPPLQ